MSNQTIDIMISSSIATDDNRNCDIIKSRTLHGYYYECWFYYLKLGFSLNFVNGEAIVISVDGIDERKEFWNELSIFIRNCDKKIIDILSACTAEKVHRHSKQLKYFPISEELRKRLFNMKCRNNLENDKFSNFWKSINTTSSKGKIDVTDNQEPLKVRRLI